MPFMSFEGWVERLDVRKVIGYILTFFNCAGMWGLWSLYCSEWPDLEMWSHVSQVYPLSDVLVAWKYKYLMSICEII